jgi:hypothetical protein
MTVANTPAPKIIAIDTDSYGSLAFMDCVNKRLGVIQLPNHKIVVNKRTRNRLTPVDLADLLRATILLGPDRIVLEEQCGRPDQDSSSTFNFGFTNGLIHGVIHGVLNTLLETADKAFKIPEINLVTGRKWKQALGLTADKSESRAEASLIYPASAHLWKTGPKTSLAEAALIATYAAVVYDQQTMKTPYTCWDLSAEIGWSA